jgi:hypothetical protein
VNPYAAGAPSPLLCQQAGAIDFPVFRADRLSGCLAFRLVG